MGTFQPSIIRVVKEKVMAPDPWGHPSQVPYVMVWQDLIEDPPEWLKPFVHKLPDSPNVQALVMETPTPPEEAKNKGPKPVLQESSNQNLIDLETEIRPLLYAPPPLQVPPGGRAPSPDESEGIREPQPRRRNRENRGEQDLGDPELPSSTVQALPVRVGPANPDGERTYQYRPFSHLG